MILKQTTNVKTKIHASSASRENSHFKKGKKKMYIHVLRKNFLEHERFKIFVPVPNHPHDALIVKWSIHFVEIHLRIHQHRKHSF